MWLPSQAQVNTAGRYVGAVAGTAIAIFGLQAKGISLDQVKVVVSQTVPLTFARLFGITNGSVSATAIASSNLGTPLGYFGSDRSDLQDGEQQRNQSCQQERAGEKKKDAHTPAAQRRRFRCQEKVARAR